MDGSKRHRRVPRQERSRFTVECILIGTSQVMVDQGYAGLSTNRVAEVSGVGISTVYQYFPNKQALVMALLDRHALAQMHAVLDVIAVSAERGLLEVCRAAFQALSEVHRQDRDLQVALLGCLDEFRHEGQVLEARQRVIEGVRQLIRSRSGAEPPPNAAWMAVMAGEGVVHAAMVESPTLLTDPDFLEQGAQLLYRYLAGFEAGA